MAFTATWKPNIGPSLVLNGTNFPIDEEFSIEVPFSDPSVEKMQDDGEWPTFGYTGAAKIICDGHILGTSKANFWNNRMAFLRALTPPRGERTSRRHGTLTIADTDMSEPVYAYCRVVSRTANLESLSPERCPYLVTFKAWTVYFTGVRTGRDYVLG